VDGNDIVLVQALRPMEKMGAFFSTGEVFFLLTSPLMGDLFRIIQAGQISMSFWYRNFLNIADVGNL